MLRRQGAAKPEAGSRLRLLDGAPGVDLVVGLVVVIGAGDPLHRAVRRRRKRELVAEPVGLRLVLELGFGETVRGPQGPKAPKAQRPLVTLGGFRGIAYWVIPELSGVNGSGEQVVPVLIQPPTYLMSHPSM